MTCPDCDGMGTTYSYHYDRDVNCRRCHGRGEIRCDNKCQSDKSISGVSERYVVCGQCAGTGYVPGVRSIVAGWFGFNRHGYFFRDEKFADIALDPPLELPLTPVSLPEHTDQTMASFREGGDCFCFADKNGHIFCVSCVKNVRDMDLEYMIEAVSKFYARQVRKDSGNQAGSVETAVGTDSREEKKTEFTDNEKRYLKCYMVAKKDGMIDASERKMLEYQAFNILKLTPKRVEELEALAQFLEEGEL